MAGVYFDKKALVPLMEHHIGIIDRYDFEDRNRFSLICIKAKDFSIEIVKSALSKILRKSDAIFNEGDYYYLLLPHTDKEGAKIISNNINSFLGEDAQTEIKTYPDDGLSFDELKQSVQNFS